MTAQTVNRNQPQLFETGHASPAGKWYLATRDKAGQLRISRHATLGHCYAALVDAGDAFDIKASEIRGPRNGQHRILDGEVWPTIKKGNINKDTHQ